MNRFKFDILDELSLELAGKTVSVAGMVLHVTTRFTRDNRRFYIVALEDLSGSIEVTVWNNTIDASTPGTPWDFIFPNPVPSSTLK